MRPPTGWASIHVFPSNMYIDGWYGQGKGHGVPNLDLKGHWCPVDWDLGMNGDVMHEMGCVTPKYCLLIYYIPILPWSAIVVSISD